MDEFVEVTPERGKMSEVGKLLLGLADDPSQVGTTSSGPLGFAYTVHPDVYVRYLAKVQGEDMKVVDEVLSSQPDPVPVKRGPGRPRKNQES